MEEIGKQYINAKTRAGFQTALDSGKVSDSQVAFIEDEDLIWARGKYYGTIPNEEDLTKDTEGKLQLSDRSYNPENFSGLGRIILRKNMSAGKNILTQEMISQANTVYEIRYDFDLSGATINIPENCTLDFQGGSLKNGTLNGSKFNINANCKIFSNIKFKGSIIYNLKLDLDWFVSDYIDGIYDIVDIDSSKQINDAINSGVKTILFPSDKYYYLKNPIIIIGDINLLSKSIERVYETNYRAAKGHLPCIYSNEIVTLLDYRYQSIEYKFGLTIGKLNFYCRKSYEALDNIETPIVKIETIGDNGIWGLNFDANITSKDFQVSIKDLEEKIYVPNYTGLKLIATNSSISYVKINGYIQIVFNGIVTETNPKTWFTDITVNGDTRAVFGGKFNGGNPVRIFGSHQPMLAAKETTEYKSYFNANWINLYGFVWDYGVKKNDGKIQTVSYPIRINTDSINGFYNSETGSTPPDRGDISYIRKDRFNLEINSFNNYLDYYYVPGMQDSISLKYKLNDISIFENKDIILYNDFNLFNTDSKSLSKLAQSAYLRQTYNCYFLVANDNLANKDNTLSFECNIRSDDFGYDEVYSPIVISSPFVGNIKVELLNKSGVVSKTFNHDINYDQSYNKNSYFLIDCFRNIRFEDISNIKIYIKLQLGKLTNLMFCELPFILFGVNRYVPKHIIYNSIPKIHSNVAKGFTFYDSVKRKHITAYSDTEWFDENGNPADALKKGTSSQRPVGVKAGFYYFDTDINKPIWKKEDTGTAWVDSTGIEV